ncbi:hypothetical protein DE146DRAFT_635676 [Phaeosphaeria sp. MPI-PUGE-AT-0046c]|nr:hypothetical protein DE146DRAFT_635676 [Phaeosphaeria sp. MPI-PUGE-AT-0046c]
MRPQLLFDAPSELTIFHSSDGVTHESTLSAELSCAHISALNTSSITVQISLLRLGTFKSSDHATRKSAPFPFLRLRKSHTPRHGFDKADTVFSTALTLSCGDFGKASQRFAFTLPSDLPPTTTFPTFEIAYSLLATSTLPWGQVLHTSQSVQISRRAVEPPAMQPTPPAYSHSALALCVSFARPKARGSELCATLHLCGVDARVLLAIEWEVEERAIITSSNTDAGPVSRALRTIDKGTVLRSALMVDSTDGMPIDLPFMIVLPRDTEFPNLSRVDSCVLDAWSPKHARCQKMGFELRMEQVLRVRISLNEHIDTKRQRREAREVYSVVLPLKGLQERLEPSLPSEGEGDVARKFCIVREVL